MTVVEFYSNSNIVEAMWKFLRLLNAGAELPPVMSRIDDRARQKACRNGYASYTHRGPDRGWRITQAGVDALLSVDMSR